MISSALLLLLALPTHALPLVQETGEPWSPTIPTLWDDEAIERTELPLASREHSPRHVPRSYYERIPTRTIWADYPVYHPDHEPPGYWDWLHEQEPRIAFDPAELRTKEDWIRAGERVFRQGDGYTTGTELAFVRDPRGYEAAGVRLTADGRFPYARYVVRELGKVELEVNSCAGCHTRVLPDGSELLGGPGDVPLGRIAAYELRELAPPATSDERVDRDGFDYRFAAAPWMDPDPGALALGRDREGLAQLLEALTPGVFVRQRTSYAHPVRTPDLIGVANRRFLDATGLFESNGLADLARYAALNFGVDELASYDGFRPAAEDGRTLPDPATLVRNSDEQLWALALFLESLEAPERPRTGTTDEERDAVERGAALFDEEGCVRCHAPPHYTNDRLVPVAAHTPTPEERERWNPMRRRVGTDPGLTLRTRRGTGYYKVPSLRGVWYRPSFLHDGSLATLEDLFDPARLGEDYVPTGYRGPFGTRRSVPGHPFGLERTAAERADLIAFLRSL